MLVTVPETATSVSLLHSPNALTPMLVTLLEMV
jgi:hypothetical protein